MSDDVRFDGAKVYEVGVAGAAIYDIRGNHSMKQVWGPSQYMKFEEITYENT